MGETYGQGSLRYFFCHGNHGDAPVPEQMTVEANIVVFTGLGRILYGRNSRDASSRYEFRDGVYNDEPGKSEGRLPAKALVERLLKNVSVPSLVAAEIPNDQIGMDFDARDPFLYISILVLGRSDLRSCTASDREYLGVMMQAFVPRLVGVMAPTANEFLPGDALNFSTDMARRMEAFEDDLEYHTFIAMYRGRYVQKSLPQRAVVEQCLVHILKMPFELNSSIQSRLIRY
ncbi:hypothetical protein N7451_000182 [Penicillium sp. IBT 35674x]|nr:hypothetical protein N7451_000182 [Penicillium sp. IBT 35674x]